ncbi:MAG: hypothetical protein F4Y08_04990 [Caldilineaceae bacterium SB0662_bin_9]|uniref:Uncharacterized protein n=1 Tax=Caldilineaceae bacterium SB0662_bin_9 TaxID=2605258 RepID=A0A6B1DSM4_9CHLR|nr:hypothetical protein [Caldilineaceae bacterium SB0662_bin_9]
MVDSIVTNLLASCAWAHILMGEALEVAEVMRDGNAWVVWTLLIMVLHGLKVTGRFTLEVGRFKLEVCGQVQDRR